MILPGTLISGEAKILLSTADAATLNVLLPSGERYLRQITRAQFDELTAGVIGRTAGPCKQALKDAGLTAAQIDEVVLVGGSTRIPAVRALVDDLFELRGGGKKPGREVNGGEVGGVGGGVQGWFLAGGSAAT